jgi:hypothetical protein
MSAVVCSDSGRSGTHGAVTAAELLAAGLLINR